MPKIVKKKKTSTRKRKNVQKRTRKLMMGGATGVIKPNTVMKRPTSDYGIKSSLSRRPSVSSVSSGYKVQAPEEIPLGFSPTLDPRIKSLIGPEDTKFGFPEEKKGNLDPTKLSPFLPKTRETITFISKPVTPEMRKKANNLRAEIQSQMRNAQNLLNRDNAPGAINIFEKNKFLRMTPEQQQKMYEKTSMRRKTIRKILNGVESTPMTAKNRIAFSRLRNSINGNTTRQHINKQTEQEQGYVFKSTTLQDPNDAVPRKF